MSQTIARFPLSRRKLMQLTGDDPTMLRPQLLPACAVHKVRAVSFGYFMKPRALSALWRGRPDPAGIPRS